MGRWCWWGVGLLTEVSRFLILLTVLLRYIGPYLSPFRNTCPWALSGQRCTVTCRNSCKLLSWLCLWGHSTSGLRIQVFFWLQDFLPTPACHLGCVYSVAAAKDLCYWVCHQTHKLCEWLEKKWITLAFKFQCKSTILSCTDDWHGVNKNLLALDYQ